MTFQDTGPIDPLEDLLQTMARRLNAIAKSLAKESYEFGRHEEKITSRFSERVNHDFQRTPLSVLGFKLDLHTEEFNAIQEAGVGADLYISLVRADKSMPISKGMLVQSKRAEKLAITSESQRLGSQCKKMRRRTPKASYVWVYDKDDIVSVKAPQSFRPKLERVSDRSSVGDLIAKGLRCDAGDEMIGRDLLLPRTDSIVKEMRRLSVRRGIDFRVRRS